MSEWEVVYHEILAISNTFGRLTNSTLGANESELHHELDGNYICQSLSCLSNKHHKLFDCSGDPISSRESATTLQYYLQFMCFRSCHTATHKILQEQC